MLEQKMAELLEKVQSFISGHAGQALDLILLYAQIMYLRNLVVPPLLLMVSIFATYRIYKWTKVHSDWDVEVGGILIVTVTYTGLVVSSIIMLVNLTDVFNWVGVFKPEIFFVEQALKLVGK
jgi:hypothetical protein